MKQKLRVFLTLLLCAVASVGWGAEEIAYTFATAQSGSNTAYASNYDVNISGMQWSVPGNQNFSGFVRIGGKQLTNVNRFITAKSAMTDAITKITFNHRGISNKALIVNSITLTVASDEAFENVIETKVMQPTFSVSTEGSFDFEPTENMWAAGCYYKFAINVSNSNSSNYGLDVASIVFYKNASGPVAPNVYFENESVSVNVGNSIINNLNKPEDLEVYYTSDNPDIASVNSTTGEVTGVAMGITTITAAWNANDSYTSGTRTYTVTVNDPSKAGTFTFVQTSKTEGTLSDAPEGVKAAFSCNGNTMNQLTAGTTMTLTISGLPSNYKVTGITLDVHNNASKGNGSATATISETTLGTMAITGLGANYQEKAMEITPTLATGDLVITISATENSVYCDKFMISYEVTDAVVLADPEFSFSNTSLELTLGDTFTAPTLSTAEGYDGTVSYSSSNEDVATVDPSSGAVTILAVGTTTITASALATDNFLADDASYTITVNAPAVSEVKVTDGNPYEESFATNFGSFTTDNTTIWTHATYNNDAYAKATSYIGGSNTDGDAWLTSPIIDLTEVAQAELEFNQAINKYFGTVADEAMLCIKEVDGEWVKQDISYPELGNKTFSSFELQTLDISAFAGKKIVVGFHYIGSSSNAGTWEVNNFKVSGSSTIQLKDAELAFTPATITVEENATATVEFTKSTTADVTFTNEDPTIATYDAATGVVSALKAGTTTITASSAANEEYNAGTATLTITVSEKTDFVEVVKGCGIYQKITSASDLEAGKRYLIVYETQDNDLNDVADVYNGVSNKIGQYVEMPLNSDMVDNTNGTATHPIVLQSAGSDNWYLMDGESFLYWTTGNYLYVSNDASQEGNTWSVNFGEDGMSINNVNTEERYIQFNPSSPRFACYAGTQKNVVLYKELMVAPISVTIGTSATGADGAYYSSVYYSDKALKVPAGVECQTYKMTDGKLTVSKTYADGSVIPAGEAVVIKASVAGKVNFVVTTTTEQKDANSMLKGCDVATTISEPDFKYYKLTLNANKDAGTAGFYFDKDSNGGTQINAAAHKCYLRIPAAQAAKSAFVFGEETTGINAVSNEQMATDKVYNLSGQRVQKATKGIYIVNGKKVVMK